MVEIINETLQWLALLYIVFVCAKLSDAQVRVKKTLTIMEWVLKSKWGPKK